MKSLYTHAKWTQRNNNSPAGLCPVQPQVPDMPGVVQLFYINMSI